jgi:hypothetical protein
MAKRKELEAKVFNLPTIDVLGLVPNIRKLSLSTAVVVAGDDGERESQVMLANRGPGQGR